MPTEKDTKTISQLTETLLTGITLESNTNQNQVAISTSAALKPLPEVTFEQKTPISDNLEDKKKLTRLVTSCYHALRQYGKSPEELEAIIVLMQMKLSKYAYEDVRAAFDKLLDTATQVPTPAEVIAIIDPSTQPKKWSATAFIDIKKRSREGQYITPEQRKYCEDYIKAQIESNSPEMAETLKVVAIEDKSYWSTS